MRYLIWFLIIPLFGFGVSSQVGSGNKIRLFKQQSGEATFQWDANKETVDGYNLYCSGPTEIKESTADVKVIVTLESGTYNCWATAYKGGLESGRSNNIIVRVFK